MERRRKQKVIAALIAALGVLLISYAALIYFGEFGFRKYVDKGAGFSIKYPQDWAYASNKDLANVIFYAPRESDYDNFTESVNVVVQDLSSNPVKIQQYTETAIRQMQAVFGENLEILESEGAYLSRRLGHKFVFVGKGTFPMKMMMVWTIQGETSYQVTYTARPDTFPYYLNDVEKMIKSFKIIGS